VRFAEPLHRGVLLRRYKRFLADVRLETGEEITAHTANPGSMLTVSRPGSTVALSRSDDPKRKLAWTLEGIKVGRSWVGIHPGRSNGLVADALRRNRLPELAGYAEVRPEARIGAKSRADFLLTDPERGRCWVEVKTATLGVGRLALFPDSRSERALRHVDELLARIRAGDRAVLLFVTPRADVDRVGPADPVDPDYGRALRRALDRGLEVHARRARLDRRGLRLTDVVPVDPGPHEITLPDD
jgi:sugar fermentation stimulation protein A